MKSHKIKATLLVSLLFSGQLLARDLEVELSGFENNTGTAIIVLHNNENSFPEDVNAAFKTVTSDIENMSVKIVFKGIPQGRYAISAIHDQNSNKELDKNFFGIPKEGVAVSGNGDSSFGPPSFDDSIFLPWQKY